MIPTIKDLQKVLFPGETREWDGVWGDRCKMRLELILNPQPASGEPALGDRADARTEGNILTLHPKLQPIARALILKGREAGMHFKITSGSRTYEEQDELFRKGKVTKARGGYSNHNFGIAFDVTEFRGNNPIWDSPNYQRMGQLGKSLGLSWGGDWESIVDEPHFELRPTWASNMSESAMISELRRRKAITQDLFA